VDTELSATFLAECERELEARWVLVGTLSQLPGPDTWFVHESAGRSVIVARDAKGSLGAFVNACTHRGTRLCKGQGTGRLQCPYHGWVFGCDGRLLGAARRAGLPPFEDADYGLATLGVATHGPFLFVHREQEPTQPLRAALGDQAATLEALPEPERVGERLLDLPWRDALAACEEGARVEPNLIVAATRLVSFTPLGPARTRRLELSFRK
jgi:phenylpropionate dioxygenase-like ring-hydroxylating dioxygenase large terminal subunit